MIRRFSKLALRTRFSSRAMIWFLRAMIWLKILKRLQGTSVKFEFGLLSSAIVDTLTFGLRPVASPRSYFSVIVRCKKFNCYWQVRKGTDDIYNVMPEREGDVDKLIRNNLKPGDTFIDIGSNIGYYTVLAAHLVGSEGKVVAIEPVPETVKVLRANCNLNHLRNVEILPTALWSYECVMPIYFSKGAFGMASVTKLGEDSTLTKAVPLDSISQSWNTIKMMKIDAEGAEYQILRGCYETLKRTKYVILECSEDCNEIMSLLSENGFSIRKMDFTTYILAKRQKEHS
jgi:FkbM family methyltransferase